MTLELSGCRMERAALESLSAGERGFWMVCFDLPAGETRIEGVWTDGGWEIVKILAFRDAAGTVPKFVHGPPGAAEAFVAAYGGSVVA